ncbi:MAG: exopolysaccharide Pel transporter PelG [Lachnospiraceae bacterium]|nr:exopolysaccharide Pel transporter PelG [Lachnospiraceae bacterium]
MAGIGVRLNKLYEKNTLITTLSGISYSMIITIAPMIIVIAAIWGMGYLLDLNSLEYYDRELFSCTILYIFIFSLIDNATINAVISRYMSDVIFREAYGEIMPCFYFGMILTLVIGLVPAVPFLWHEFFVGGVEPVFILLSFLGYVGLCIVFYVMMYLGICKDYAKISLFYFIGIGIGFLFSLVLHFIFKVQTTYAMLAALDLSFLIIATLEYALILSYFKTNDHKYTAVLTYFKKYWSLIVSNTVYILGLYVHNFVFWTTDMRMVVADTFVCAEPFDMATFIALATNISATVIFITSVEQRFHFRYRKYSETILGGRLLDIDSAKDRMFRQLGVELINLVRTQFIISVAIFLGCIVLLPQLGISGLVMQIYPCVAAGYFILFLLYGALIFLYYFNDLVGALLVSLSFFVTDLVVSIFATGWREIWYGAGVVAGAFVGWCIAYIRLRWVEKNMDRHIFCEGHLMEKGHGKRPSDLVWKRGRDAVSVVED